MLKDRRGGADKGDKLRVESGKLSVVCAKGVVPKGKPSQLSNAAKRSSRKKTERFSVGLALRERFLVSLRNPKLGTRGRV